MEFAFRVPRRTLGRLICTYDLTSEGPNEMPKQLREEINDVVVK
jgi:hypothetical protein